MAIVFDCPHCKTNYRLKDEFAGKTATCKNPNCRKIIPIPKPTTPAAAKNVDIDALAAAAFSDEPVQGPAVAEETIQVTCSGCDHVWSVEASREGKNVLCPECRRPNRVPLRKKEEKADWRSGQGGPSLRKVETGMDVQGAFASNQAGAISTSTAKEIMRDRDAQEEPEVRRKRLIKRGIIGFVLIVSLSAAGYFAFKKRTEVHMDAKMEDALTEFKGKDGKERPSGPMFALIHRASGEYRIKAAANADEAKQALTDLKLARNSLPKPNPNSKTMPGVEHDAILAEVAITMVELLGTAEQVESGVRFKKDGKDSVITEIRRTLTGIADKEIMADAMRGVTRKLAEKGQVSAAEEIARGLPIEMLGQVGLEELRIDKENKYRPEVEKLLGSVQAGPQALTQSIQTLRLIFAKPGKKGAEPQSPPAASYAEKAALAGDVAAAKSAATTTRNPVNQVHALVAAAHVLSESNPAEAGNLAQQAATLFSADPSMPVSPWIAVRICRLLSNAGKVDAAEALAAKLPTSQAQAQSWARLEILRGRLAQTKEKADSTLLTPVGDPEKVAAAAEAYEEIARHNALNGHDFQAITKTWKPGTVRPFGIAGLVLGQQDRNGK